MKGERAATIIRRSLKRLIRENTRAPLNSQETRWRSMLKGGATARTQASKKAREYLAVMAVEKPATKPIPSSLFVTLAELRASANNVRLHCALRIQSVEKLLRISGFSCGVHHGDATDALIDSRLGTKAPETQPAKSVTNIRRGARSQAYEDVVECFRADRANGLIRTLDDAERALRLPEMEPITKPEPSLSEEQKTAISAAIEAFKRGSHGVQTENNE